MKTWTKNHRDFWEWMDRLLFALDEREAKASLAAVEEEPEPPPPPEPLHRPEHYMFMRWLLGDFPKLWERWVWRATEERNTEGYHERRQERHDTRVVYGTSISITIFIILAIGGLGLLLNKTMSHDPLSPASAPSQRYYDVGLDRRYQDEIETNYRLKAETDRKTAEIIGAAELKEFQTTGTYPTSTTTTQLKASCTGTDHVVINGSVYYCEK